MALYNLDLYPHKWIPICYAANFLYRAN